MPGLILPQQWRQQPQQAVKVASRFASRLKFAFLPSVGFVNLGRSALPLQTSGDFTRGITPAGITYFGGARAEFAPLLDASNGLTLISIWRARPAQYLGGDSERHLLSNRSSGNTGWSWGRLSAIGGGTTGNLTSQLFVMQGIAAYQEANYTIESLVDTPVAVRYSKQNGLVSWFRFGQKSSPDTAASTPPSAGANLVMGAQGDFASNLAPWIDQAAVVLGLDGELTDAEIKALTESTAAPWQAFQAPARRIWVSAGAPAGTAALTGAGATGATGTASPGTSIAATGNSSTGAVGTASPSTSVATTGNAATSAVGTVASGITVGLTGIGATGAVGSVSTGADVTAALSGVGATAAVGSLGVDRSKALTSTSATAGTGTATVSRDSALTGANATAQPGSVAHNHAIGLTGIPATGAVGSVGATQAGVASLTGTPSTASAGTATASLSTASTGVSGSGQVGAPVVARESTIAGVSASSAVGSVGLSVTVALSGITATASVGTVVVPSGDIVVAITGVSVIGLVGTMTGSDVIYARAPSGSGYRRPFENTTRSTQQNTTRNKR